MINSKDTEILDFIEKNKGLTINQCYKLFFNYAVYGKDLARKKLKTLAEHGWLKYAKDWASNQRVYYIDKKPSSHSVILLDFLAELTFNKAEILVFEREYKIGDICTPDAFCIFKYHSNKDIAKLIFIEVDMQNKTNLEKYKKLYDTNLLQKEYGSFPEVIIIATTKNYDTSNYPFSVKLLDYKFSNIKEQILNF